MLKKNENLPATFVQNFHDEELCRRMEYGPFGRTGFKLSKVSLGCGTLSPLYGDLDLEEAIATVQQSLHGGINYIDTAPFYGQGRSEEILGMALKNVPREAYYIATKVGRYEQDFENMFDFSAPKSRASVEKSLKLLGLSYIDIIQIHDIEFAPNLEVVINECLPELEKLVNEGKAKFIGVTSYSLSILKKFLELVPNRIHVVLTYARNTLMDNTLKDYIEFFQNNNLGIVCASGHAMGMLTNSGPQKWHPATEEQKLIAQKAANICLENDIELGKLAMYHFMKFKGCSTYLCGIPTRKILNINLNAYYNGLTRKEYDILQLLQKTIFTTSTNWEDLEVNQYWTAMNQNNLNS